MRGVAVIAAIRAAGQSRGMARSVALLAVPNAQILDVTGPLEVFSSTNRELRDRGATRDAYRTRLLTPAGGACPTSSGVSLQADGKLAGQRGALDTLVVAGGLGIRPALDDAALLANLRRVSRRARRVTSVCTGAFLLAEIGTLDGRRATTHWSACAALARRHPRVQVEVDPIFVRDGAVWTSAGVTAGMDLALALVEEDHGRDVALAVARRLVMFLKRPGGQSQFSGWLDAQRALEDPLDAVRNHVIDHPAEDLRVETLAQRAGMSPRNFARVFARASGVTPARFVEAARVEAARVLLEEGADALEPVAAACGFGSVETLRRAFLRRLKVGPAEYRRRFRRRGAEPAASPLPPTRHAPEEART